jgi:hypothetical protein
MIKNMYLKVIKFIKELVNEHSSLLAHPGNCKLYLEDYSVEGKIMKIIRVNSRNWYLMDIKFHWSIEEGKILFDPPLRHMILASKVLFIELVSAQQRKKKGGKGR